MPTRIQGTVKQWNNEQGFGYIHSDEYAQDVLCHISAFTNSPMGINPSVGDIINFQVNDTPTGLQATNAMYPNAINHTSETPSEKQRFDYKPFLSSAVSLVGSILRWLIYGVIMMAILAGGYYLYQNYWVNNQSSEPNFGDLTNPIYSESVTQTNSNTQNYTCDGRQHCSQMRSYDEAKYFIQHCPNTKMDGDNDGIPCERQFGK